YGICYQVNHYLFHSLPIGFHLVIAMDVVHENGVRLATEMKRFDHIQYHLAHIELFEVETEFARLYFGNIQQLSNQRVDPFQLLERFVKEPASYLVNF